MDDDIESLNKEICKLRNILYEANLLIGYEEKKEEILSVSKEMDELIVKYMKIKDASKQSKNKDINQQI